MAGKTSEWNYPQQSFSVRPRLVRVSSRFKRILSLDGFQFSDVNIWHWNEQTKIKIIVFKKSNFPNVQKIIDTSGKKLVGSHSLKQTVELKFSQGKKLWTKFSYRNLRFLCCIMFFFLEKCNYLHLSGHFPTKNNCNYRVLWKVKLKLVLWNLNL